jgi:hypothetical protein
MLKQCEHSIVYALLRVIFGISCDSRTTISCQFSAYQIKTASFVKLTRHIRCYYSKTERGKSLQLVLPCLGDCRPAMYEYQEWPVPRSCRKVECLLLRAEDKFVFFQRGHDDRRQRCIDFQWGNLDCEMSVYFDMSAGASARCGSACGAPEQEPGQNRS